MQRCGIFLSIFLLAAARLAGREFMVMAYNVENLFDVDGAAQFAEYKQGDKGPYGVEQLLNKLEGIRRSLAAVNGGAGPEVVMFQEFELDRTPKGTPEADAFLAATAGRKLADLLREDPSAANLPSELLLLKYLADHGIRGYQIAQPDTRKIKNPPAHKNVVFSRFPVREVRQRPMPEARDLLVVVLDVDGHQLVLLNNHWKSGASDPATELARIGNAQMARRELDEILAANPRADVILAGDLNSHYNQKAVIKDLPLAAVNDILGAHGDEPRLLGKGGPVELYNLWHELPPEQRGSEVWRGRWSTLMQMILTPGMYDKQGIQYVDNSFNRLVIPGENIDDSFGRPVPWTNYGGGAGYSDHLPIYARFRALSGKQSDQWVNLGKRQVEPEPGFQPAVPYAQWRDKRVADFAGLGAMSPAQRAARVGDLFRADTTLAEADPPRVRAGDLLLQLYSHDRGVRAKLDALKPGDPVRFIGDLDDYRGDLQLVIQHKSWLLER